MCSFKQFFEESFNLPRTPVNVFDIDRNASWVGAQPGGFKGGHGQVLPLVIKHRKKRAKAKYIARGAR